MRSKHEAGNILLLTALSLVFLMGFLGLAIDMGMMRYEKRLQQTAADAAALAGANDLANLGSGSVVTAGQDAATADGFTDTSGGSLTPCASWSSSTAISSSNPAPVCVQVNNPPTYLGSADPHSGDPNYVEAVVEAVHPTYFMGFVKIYAENVVARAEATDLSGNTPYQQCFTLLGYAPNQPIGFDDQGNPTLNASSCGIVDNGNFDPTGGGKGSFQVNAGTFGVSGGDIGNGPCGGSNGTCSNVTCKNQSPCPAYNAPTAQNPMASVATPCSLGYTCTPGTGSSIKPTGTVSCPGYVCNYSSISINGGSVTFAPGIYIIDGSGGLSCSGNPSISGTGVMLFFTGSATFNCTGTGRIDLTAPTSNGTSAATFCNACSQYNGILMYQDPADTNSGLTGPDGNGYYSSQCPNASGGGPSLGGNDGSQYNGVLYFPLAQPMLYGNTKTENISIDSVVAYSVCLHGNATFTVTGTTGLGGATSTLSNAVLVE